MKRLLYLFLCSCCADAAYDSEFDKYYDVGVSQMNSVLYDSGDVFMDLSQENIIEASALNQDNYKRLQDIIYRDGTDESITSGNTSPGVFSATFQLQLSEIVAGNIISFTTYWRGNVTDWPSNAFGLSVTDEGMLRLSRNNRETEVGDNITEIDKLEQGISYTITLTSIAQPLYTDYVSSSGDYMIIGQGENNFTITLSDGLHSHSITAAGFGLNGDEFDSMIIGSTEGLKGTMSKLVITTIPEPAASALCFAALIVLARRRR